jgi:glycosyltransferase involved in cell wall biosynthesis
MKQPLVSIIVTTRNNTATLDACLASIAAQTYKSCELIVVDNNSTDDTKAIAHRYTTYVYNEGPERSAQRNYAARCAKGDYLLIIDSDMELEPAVVADCVRAVQTNPALQAVIIPEESFGQGFWAQCKRLERSFYVGVDSIEAARFFDKKLYQQVGGYDEIMTGGEDWDLTRRVRAHTQVGRASEFIYHNEGRPYFMRTVRKMYYYGQHAAEYFAKNPTRSPATDQSGPLARYKLFFSHLGKLLRNPIVGAGMLLLKTAEYAAAGLGYVQATHFTFKKSARSI